MDEWDYVKDKVYRKKVASIVDLKARISAAIQSITLTYYAEKYVV